MSILIWILQKCMPKIRNFKNKLENSNLKVLKLEISYKVGISKKYIKVRNSSFKVGNSKIITGLLKN